MENIHDIFEKKGGEFVSSPFSIKERLPHIKAVVSDWDGVFHSGYKNEHCSSSFSEADSMGFNMLRFGLYLERNEMPVTGILTGENNETSFSWAEREHLDLVIFNLKNKVEALRFLKKQYNINPDEILFIFDDILDLSLAKEVGLRFLVNRNANPFFIKYCKTHKLCDYITYSDGNNHAVREVSELCLKLMGKFEETIEKRMEFTGDYQPYLEQRNDISTEIITLRDGMPVSR